MPGIIAFKQHEMRLFVLFFTFSDAFRSISYEIDETFADYFDIQVRIKPCKYERQKLLYLLPNKFWHFLF